MPRSGKICVSFGHFEILIVSVGEDDDVSQNSRIFDNMKKYECRLLCVHILRHLIYIWKEIILSVVMIIFLSVVICLYIMGT